jgi:hypothetical protein
MTRQSRRVMGASELIGLSSMAGIALGQAIAHRMFVRSLQTDRERAVGHAIVALHSARGNGMPTAGLLSRSVHTHSKEWRPTKTPGFAEHQLVRYSVSGTRRFHPLLTQTHSKGHKWIGNSPDCRPGTANQKKVRPQSTPTTLPTGQELVCPMNASWSLEQANIDFNWRGVPIRTGTCLPSSRRDNRGSADAKPVGFCSIEEPYLTCWYWYICSSERVPPVPGFRRYRTSLAWPTGTQRIRTKWAAKHKIGVLS